MSPTSDRTSAANGKSDALSLDSNFDAVSPEQWTALAERSLGDNGTIETLDRESVDGIKVAPLYFDRPESTQPDETASAEPLHWDNRLQVLGNDPVSCQNHLTAGLGGGVHSFYLDLPSMGLPGDAKFEPALDTILEGVYLDLAPVHLIPGEFFAPAGEALQSIFEKRNYVSAQLSGSIGADPFSVALMNGATQSHYEQSLGAMAGLAQSSCARYPGLRYARIDVVSHHNAGATPVQEIVAAIATAADYLDALLNAGMALETALNSLSFSVACDADLVSNIVKLRSLKRLWAHAVSQIPESAEYANTAAMNCVAHIEAHTSHRMLSMLDPWVNHLRNVTATSAAAIAGSHSITVHPHDLVDGHRIGNDAELSDRVARNLPIVLAEESLLNSVVDPTAGSYAIETLTEQTTALAWRELGALQRRGGLLAAVRDGDWTQALASSHQKRVQRLIDSVDLKVGVNHQRTADAPVIDPAAIIQAPVSAAAWMSTTLPSRRESSVFEGAST